MQRRSLHEGAIVELFLSILMRWKCVKEQTLHGAPTILNRFVINLIVKLYGRVTASGKTVPISSSNSVNTKCVLCRH
jgi:hypothetical protein